MKNLVYTNTYAIVVALAALGCGDDGAPGRTSAAIQGEDGRPGKDGRDGADGEDGRNGENGEQGEAGPPGAEGPRGADGADGQDGEDGSDGRDGEDGRNAGDLDFGVAAAVPLSILGHDRLYGAAYDEDGNLYVTGMISDDVAASADSSFLLAKFLPSGELDEGFGEDGVARVNVSAGGGSREMARGVVVQSTGAIVIAGQAEHDPAASGVLAADLDIVLARFDPDGVLDVSFGTGGVARIDLNSGVEGTNNQGQPAVAGADSQWGLALADDDKLVVHGSQRALGNLPNGMPRTDADFALLRLTADGELDATFNASGPRPGVVTLDLQDDAGNHAGASARAATVLGDDSIVAFGYLSSQVLGQQTQQPLLYKVLPDGTFDASFAAGGDPDSWGAPGVWHGLAVAPPLRAEAYGGALQGTSFVTMGYGPTTGDGTGTDWVSFRFSADGVLDATYGDGGSAYVDAGGYGDNGRFVMVLPDDRVLGAGVGRAAPQAPLPEGEQPEPDAMVAILTANGAPDTSFAEGGFRLYDLGGNDHFWSGAVSPDGTRAAVVGIAGADPAESDDDAALLLLRL